MGKASAPDAPDYKGQAIATANTGKYSELSPLGAVNWRTRPGADPLNPLPGDSIRETSLSPEQQRLYAQLTGNQLQAGAAGSTMLHDLAGGGAEMQDALYRRGTRYYDDRFREGEAETRARLENSGLAAGSTAYDRAMRDFGRVKNDAYADAGDRALIGADTAQNSAVSRLSAILAASRGQAPTSANVGAPTDLAGAAEGQYKAALGKVNAQNASDDQTAATIGAILAAAISDRRLKSNIIAIGQGYSGLTIYEYDIFGHRERGYMADEVSAIAPDAVVRYADGYDRVFYDLLGGRP